MVCNFAPKKAKSHINVFRRSYSNKLTTDIIQKYPLDYYNGKPNERGLYR